MLNNKYVRIRNMATFIIVGNMLHWLFPFGLFVWRLAMIILSLWVILSQERKRLPFENAILVFAISNLTYFIISYFWIVPQRSVLGNTLYALIPLCLFMWLSQKGVMSERFISVLSLLLLVASILSYYHSREMYIDRLGAADDAEVTVNASGLFLFLIPMLFLIKNIIQKWAVLLVCLFFLILGVKRGNILASIIPVLIFVQFELKGVRHSFIKSFLIIILLSISTFLIYQWVISNDYFFYRLELAKEGDSSGRDALYAECWQLWIESNNIITYLFGFGYDGTLHQIGKYAHNDWLEILVDFGLFGIVLYLIVFVSFVFQIRKTKDNIAQRVLWSVFIIWVFKSIYSMGYSEPGFIIMMISVGTVLGKYKQKHAVVDTV